MLSVLELTKTRKTRKWCLPVVIMKLDEFRRIVLEPDPEVAREMSAQQRHRVSLRSPSSSAAKTDSKNSGDKISDKNSGHNSSSDKFLSTTRSQQLPSKRSESSNKNNSRVSPPKLKSKQKSSVAEAPPTVEEPLHLQKKNFVIVQWQRLVDFLFGFYGIACVAARLPSAVLHWCKIQLDPARLPGSQYLVVPVALYAAAVLTMTYPLFALCRLILGTLYPAYASYKAVRTKNVREYVSRIFFWSMLSSLPI